MQAVSIEYSSGSCVVIFNSDSIIGRNDASISLLLKGDGRGNFKPINSHQVGFFFGGYTYYG